jgi:hypothetical protein
MELGEPSPLRRGRGAVSTYLSGPAGTSGLRLDDVPRRLPTGIGSGRPRFGALPRSGHLPATERRQDTMARKRVSCVPSCFSMLWSAFKMALSSMLQIVFGEPLRAS